MHSTAQYFMISVTVQTIILLHSISCILAFTATYHSNLRATSFPNICYKDKIDSTSGTLMNWARNNEQENESSPQSIHDANVVDKDNDDSIDTESQLHVVEDKEKLSKKEIAVSASIILPFQADIAFSAFADLPRQPTWSNWLHSVEYTDEIDDDNKEEVQEIDGIALRETKWVMQWKKAFRFSWKSRVTNIMRPSLIEWESTSGLRNMGKIEFTEQEVTEQVHSEENGGETKGAATKMVLTMKFIAPRIVASVMKRSETISTFMEDKMLMPTLINFRNIVMEKDLGIQLEECDKEE